MGEQIDLLGTLVTPRIKRLARDRLTGKARLLQGQQLSAKRRSEIKLALILVRIMNPCESLTEQEEAILRGMHRETLRKLKTEKLVRPL